MEAPRGLEAVKDPQELCPRWRHSWPTSAVVTGGISQRCAVWLTDAGWRDYAAGVRAYSMDLRERIVAAVDAG
jgi:hypothetical protein